MENQSFEALSGAGGLDALAALAAVDRARSDAAERLTTPWWYHPILGLLAAVFVVALTIGGLVVTMCVFAVYFIGLGVLMGAYRSKTGVWINGLRAGKASWWTFPLGVVMLLCAAVPYYLHATLGLDWPAWAAGAIIFISVNFFGRRFDLALRAQSRRAL